MKSLAILITLFASFSLAQAEVSKNTVVPKLGAADVKVKFTTDVIIPAGARFVDFPTTANTKACVLYMKAEDPVNDRRIKLGVEKTLKYKNNSLEVQGESTIYGILCKPNGSWDLTNITVQDIENSAGGTMTFAVTPPVPVDVT